MTQRAQSFPGPQKAQKAQTHPGPQKAQKAQIQATNPSAEARSAKVDNG